MAFMRKFGKSTAKLTEAVKISDTEETIIRKLFETVVYTVPHALLDLEKNVGSDHDRFCQVMVRFGMGSGSILPMIRFFILEEFLKNSKDDPGSIMRGNCIASKVCKAYLKETGRKYLSTLFQDFIDKIETMPSMELDPLKVSAKDIPKNKEHLIEALRQLVSAIVRPEAIHSMPESIKTIASYLAEFANQYAPDQFYPLVGGFLFLRYMNPALMTPESYGLMPEGKVPSPTARRNLILITKILQNVSNGLEFGSKEGYMCTVNDWIRGNSWKFEKYFQTIVQTAPQTPSKIIDKSPLTQNDYRYMHGLFTKRMDILLDACEENEIIAQEILEQLELLKQYTHIDVFLDRKYPNDTPANVRVQVQVEDQMYEVTLDTFATPLQKPIKEFLKSVRKRTEKDKPKEKAKKELGMYFGRSLQEVMEAQNKSMPGLKAPSFILSIVNLLIRKAQKVEGVFRVPGNKETLEQLKKDLDQGIDRISKMDDVHVVASVLKTYFRELPEAICTEAKYSDFVEAMNNNDHEKRLQRVRQLVQQLPGPNKDLLLVLLRLLWMFDHNSGQNNMTASNLAIVFGPNLIASRFKSKGDIMAESAMANQCVELMILNYHVLFKEQISAEDHNLLNSKGPIWKLTTVAAEKSIAEMIQISDTQVATSSAGVIRVWNTDTMTMRRECSLKEYGHILAMQILEDAIWVATDNSLLMVDFSSPSSATVIGQGGASAIVRVDSNMAWTNSLEKNEVNQHTLDGKHMGTVEVPDVLFVLCTVSTKRGVQVWGGALNGSVFAWKYPTNEIVVNAAKVHSRKVNSLVASEDLVWSGGDDGAVVAFSLDTFDQVKRIDAHAGKIKSLSFFAGRLWLSTWDTTIKVYKSTSPYSMQYDVKEHHTDAVSNTCFVKNSKSGKWYMHSSGYDGCINSFLLPENLQPTPSANFLTVSELQTSAGPIPHAQIQEQLNKQAESQPAEANQPQPQSNLAQKFLQNVQQNQKQIQRHTAPPRGAGTWYGNTDQVQEGADAQPVAPDSNTSQVTINDWFLMHITSRGQAQDELSKCAVNAFLVRQSSVPNCYALSKYEPASNVCWHFIIASDENNSSYLLKDSSDPVRYPTLEELVSKTPELVGFQPILKAPKKQL